MVIELPVLYSISSAENFADGAIKILNSLKNSRLCVFGSETPNLAALDHIANILYNEPKNIKHYYLLNLAKDYHFPKPEKMH